MCMSLHVSHTVQNSPLHVHVTSDVDPASLHSSNPPPIQLDRLHMRRQPLQQSVVNFRKMDFPQVHIIQADLFLSEMHT
jgi:hypothetical protein